MTNGVQGFMQKQKLQIILFFFLCGNIVSLTSLKSQDRIRIAIWGDSKDNHLGACV